MVRVGAFAAAAAVAVVAIVLAVYFNQGHVLATSVGEQRTMGLPDGSRVELNTSSRLVQAYDEHIRKVVLESGEAWFEVSHDPLRPFVVVAGGHEIRALGTTFIVRRDANEVAVTLLDGQVAVQSIRESSSPEHGVAPPDMLTPGQRLTLRTQGPSRVDSPELARVTAWQHGQVIFEDTPLPEAIADFSRYSDRKLVCALAIAKDACDQIRVGGTFRVGDVASFARAVAAAHNLKAVVGRDRVELTDLSDAK